MVLLRSGSAARQCSGAVLIYSLDEGAVELVTLISMRAKLSSTRANKLASAAESIICRACEPPPLSRLLSSRETRSASIYAVRESDGIGPIVLNDAAKNFVCLAGRAALRCRQYPVWRSLCDGPNG